MKKFKILAASIFGCILIHGQSSSTQSKVADILPPTPQTYNFSVQNTNFVNTPSGEFTYDLLLHQITTTNFSLPINLSYRSGVKVDDQGGNVGISWQLSGGGVVSRVVRDMPDELAPKRWLQNNIDLIADAQKIKEASIPGEYVDTEYDWFNFNVSNGFSGSFYFDDNLNPIYSGDDFKISKILNTMSDGKKYIEFIITDKLGNKYFFGGQKKYVEETTITVSDNAGNNGPHLKPKSATGWFLYKIITASGKNILLDYETDSYDFFSSVDSSLNVDQKCACNGSTGLQFNTSIVDSKIMSAVTGTRLISISTDSENVYFLYNKFRNDVSGSISSLLTSVQLKDKGSHLIKNYSLSYNEYVTPVSSYYMSSSNLNTRYRYFLSQITEQNSSQKHQFEYYQPESLPSRFSLSTDYYGYFNGKNNYRPFPVINDFNSLDIRTVIPIIKNKIPTNYISADKEVNPAIVHYGNLKKIVYPTGGNSTILYEPNKTSLQLPVEKYSSLEFDLQRKCGGPRIVDEKKTFTSNGEDIFLDAVASVDYYRCGEPDDLHEVYGMSVKDLYTGAVIWSKNKKVSEGSFTTDMAACIQGVSEACPIQTIAGRNYEITFRVSSILSEISGYLSVKYNKTIVLEDKNVFYAGSRVQKIVENNNEGSSYSKNYFYNFYSEKNNQKTKISFYVKPRFFYIKAGVKNCYFDCGCYDLPIGQDRAICMGNTDTGSGAVLTTTSVGYTTNSLFNNFNNRSNKPFYSVITEEVEGKSVLERVYNEYDDTPSLTFTGSEIYNLPYSNTSNLLQGKIKEENVYEFRNSDYHKIEKNIYDYDLSKNFMLKSFVFKQNYPIPPYFSANAGYIDNISIAEYYNHYGEAKVKQLNKEEIIDASSLYSITTNQYTNQNNYQLSKQKITSHDGTIAETAYQYAHEKNNSQLINANMIGIPLEVEVKKQGKILSKTETKYDNPTIPLPSSVLSYDALSGTSSIDVTYDKYDTKGNLLQYTTKAGIPTAIIWGYNNTQPIAKVNGATYDQLNGLGLISAIVSASDSDALSSATEPVFITALDNFRKNASLSGMQITTYTYDPLIGVTSITPPSGLREVYLYDSANRLKEIRQMETDSSGNITYKTVKEFKYNYKN